MFGFLVSLRLSEMQLSSRVRRDLRSFIFCEEIRLGWFLMAKTYVKDTVSLCALAKEQMQIICQREKWRLALSSLPAR